MGLFRKAKPVPQPRNPELSQLSFDALLEKKVEIDDAIKQRGGKELDGLVARFNALASSLGVSVASLFGLHIPEPREERAPVKDKKKRENKAKYRNPSNPDEVWTGRGHSPAWLKELIEAGHQKEEYLIERAPQDGPATL